ncbi:xanthine dehydrogenase [Aspergillus fischeri NRRL 181]|uniref:xanthine dehydrogenase n=1 Tax=Neosartorya fischeri (strain ATCC 1020 / DSM 3700 / CBS 544.65 / FGSC A1164 / JCM 1740 / NRRL 181 / WB 181) TaxID=331117 RepID=A1DAB1_NEOFI|nr:xanthine dehydrogenase [Aspergillus fischeri NRRL 181]EAW19801.1 xanthine dehydrogenase [Aspergillus fischeri NRRL 181]
MMNQVNSADPTLQELLRSYSSTLSFYLNGTRIDLQNPNPHWTLLDFIRSQHGLKGTKLGCGEGGCGACTVVLQTRDIRNPRRIRHLAVNACLYPLIGVAGKHVITVEGLGNADHPHPLQERLGKLHASQCGFCTPGIIMSLYALIRNAFDPDTLEFTLCEDDIEMKGHLDGNLCRCTGYKPILEAAKTFIQQDLQLPLRQSERSSPTACGNPTISADSYGENSRKSCGRPGGCCRDTPETSCSSSPSNYGQSSRTSLSSQVEAAAPQFEFIPYIPTTELIYPPGLSKHIELPLCYGNEQRIWIRPTTLEQLIQIKTAYPSATLVNGASEVQVDIRLKNSHHPVSIFIGHIKELTNISTVSTAGDISDLVIGGTASLSDIEAECHRLIPLLQPRASVIQAIAKALRYFAGRQIRNAASLAGNIATASPISDMNPLLLAVNATVVSRTAQGEHFHSMDSMFLGYRKTALPEGAIITQIRIPIPPPEVREITKSYKQAKRKDDDIAIVAAGFRVRLNDHAIVQEVTLAYGGMAPTTVLAPTASKSLIGKKWGDTKVLEEALDALLVDFNLPYSVPGGMATYRRTLALSLLVRFWNEVLSDLQIGDKVDTDLTREIHRKISHGTRDNRNPHEQRVVGKQIPHLSGLKHATGEAEYVDDMPPQHRELFGAMVLSQRAHAKIISVDWTPALQPGLAVGYIDHHSIPREANAWGSVKRDEPFFAVDEVVAHGQPIGLVYADTALQAQAAAKAVRVVYQDLPAILAIDEAIAARSFFPHGKELRKGASPEKMQEVFAQCDRVFTGTTRVGGQEHFYLETNAALVIPHSEDGTMEVWSSTQNTMETQEFVSLVTGVPSHRINARVKRMGGAFGGKESRSVQLACLLAIAAKKERRPVRAMLNRDEDMMTTGQRHPVQCRWKVGVMNDGRLVALDADCYSNAGFSLDMSGAVMDRCCTHLDNCYHIPNVHIRGWVCRTNTHSNTAFRGFGGPQAMFIAESYMTAVAEGLNLPIDELRRRNLYEQGQLTPFLQRIDEDWHVPLLMEQVRREAQYDEQRAAVDKFNAQHRWRKRGICLIPTKFGLSFATAVHLNQAAASVRIYADGSILLNHGGTEMGQGLYTKMVQVAAEELGVPIESIYTQDTSSYQTANPSPTAASSGSDLNGMAVKDACDQLNERLKPYREKFGPDAPMSTIAHAAYLDRVNLTANGFWKMPKIGYQWGSYDPKTVKPMYYYFTQGVACTEVELDLLTGDHTVLRTDIKMDVGRSINPAIDYGQVEGAFIQGQGLFTMEESLWSRDGQLATRGPSNYKIPAFGDIPQEFNVSFLQDVSWQHLRSIQSSKGCGEPPLFLGSTVLFALRDALKSAREDHQVLEPLVLDSPATAEKLRLAVGDPLVKRARVEAKGGETPFFVSVA